ncbi:MAG: hypothetical protein WC334_06455, partial [Kiritimatiellales bacterium]
MKKSEFIVWFALMAGMAGYVPAADEFTIESKDFDAGSVKVSLKGQQFADEYSCIWHGSGSPDRAEYTVEFPVTADYTLSGLYTAAQSRPVDILVDGKKVHTGFAGVTGSWSTKSAKWEEQCTLRLTAGTHIIILQRQGPIPHICALKVQSSVPFPDGWTLKRPAPEQRIAGVPGSAPDTAYWQSRLSIEFNPPAFERAVKDLFKGAEQAAILKEAARYTGMAGEAKRLFGSANEADRRRAITSAQEILAYKKKILLRNPVLDFDELLLLKRRFPNENIKAAKDFQWNWGNKYGFTGNWVSDYRGPGGITPVKPPDWGWQDAFVIRPLHDDAPSAEHAVYTPPPGRTLLHPELHFDAKRFAFAAPGTNNNFQVCEMNLDGTGLRQVTRDIGADVDNGDPCYLPDGRIIFTSSRGFAAVPCTDGGSWSDGLCVMDADGSNEKMLTFDQMSNWHPSLLHDGRVMYTRFEYGNYSHQYGRLLFTMNPDGTKQTALYGSNSYWPNSIFHARAVPGSSSMVAGIVCGHHGPSKYGKLILFDPSKGRNNADGVVQAVPGFGKKVEPVVADELYGKEYPKFAFPWPLDEKTLIVSGRLFPEQKTLGVYLVDIYDNITEIASSGDYSYLEPIPVKKRPVPPAIPDMTHPDDKEATLFVQDIYTGPGLKGVPRGTVKQ